MRTAISYFVISFICLYLTNESYSQNLQLSGGNNFSVALCDNQIVYAWGRNNLGQIGLNASLSPYPAASYNTPQRVYGLPLIKQIDAGSGAHTIALACDNYVWVWGQNNCGQKGQGGAAPPANCSCTDAASPTPQRVLRGAADAGFHDGTYLNNVRYVSGGNNSTYVILSNGQVMAWGENTYGQLGDGTNTHRNQPVYVLTGPGTRLQNIVQIEGGDDCAYALDASGQVWSWGKNQGRELG
ncbi:MAG: hypothetical protein NZ529_11720, partial [Cytophagaceae bacterium]|nr:hypothetical protein [Cytophagaceae bacterium]MDW8457452.1 hypothetical protein [Cytophagaceae bacterium]